MKKFHKNMIIAFVAMIIVGITAFSDQQNIENKIKVEQKVTSELKNILDQVPTAARVRVGDINSFIKMNEKELPIYTFNMRFAVTRHGFRILPLGGNLPLSQWTDILPVIINNKCTFTKTKDLVNNEVAIRTKTYNINAVLICPLLLSNNKVFGVSFLSWDNTHPITDNEDIKKDTLILQEGSNKIVNILENNR